MKSRVVAITLAISGIFMINMANIVNDEISNKNKKNTNNNVADIVNVINMSSSNREYNVEVVDMNMNENNQNIEEMKMEQAPQSVYIPPRVEVYEGMTLEELGEKLNHSLGTTTLANKGLLIATKCIELGVDPYIATAIMLHETGCPNHCSRLLVTCNNVGGQKGSPNCGNGSYKYYATLDDGITGHIENLARNYFSQGRNTIETIAPKYAESTEWPGKITWFVGKIRES